MIVITVSSRRRMRSDASHRSLAPAGKARRGREGVTVAADDEELWAPFLAFRAEDRKPPASGGTWNRT
jgi:hypothetical protein